MSFGDGACAGKLEDLILSALESAQPDRLSMRSILKRIGVSTVERKKVRCGVDV